MKVFLGVDGGGTKTRAILVEPTGRILGEGAAGPSNYHNVGLAAAMANIKEAVARAWSASEIRARMPDGAFLGCAGIKSSSDIACFTSAAETAGIAPAGEILVANDLHNALTGGLAGQPGIALIAGTGTNCLGRDVSGKSYMCGGWGWLLDDQGGGFGLALAGMQAVARAADGRAPATPLLDALLAFLGLSEPNELLARLYVQKWTPDEIAAFGPVVIRFASEGEPTALKIVKNGASALANLVSGAARQLDFPRGPDVVLLGGCARSGTLYRPLIERAILAVCPTARLSDPMLSTTQGAALNVLRAAGVAPLPLLTK